MVKTLKIATLKLSNVDRYKIAQQNEYLISRFFFYITDLKFLFEVNNSLFFFFFALVHGDLCSVLILKLKC